MAELVCAGTSIGERTSSTRMRPKALRRASFSLPPIGVATAVIRARASSTDSAGAPWPPQPLSALIRFCFINTILERAQAYHLISLLRPPGSFPKQRMTDEVGNLKRAVQIQHRQSCIYAQRRIGGNRDDRIILQTH